MYIYHDRKSIRLKGYDYSRKGMYFVTICTKDREEILSKIIAVGARGTVPTQKWHHAHPETAM